jgi:hypothetical protein
MAMTRAKLYTNYKGGRQFVNGKEKGRKIENSTRHEGKEEQNEREKASLMFSKVLECKAHEGYQNLRKEILKEQTERGGNRKEQENHGKFGDYNKLKVEVY